MPVPLTQDLGEILGGKGVYLRWFHAAPAGRSASSASTVRDKCLANGVEWVAPLCLWQNTRKSGKPTLVAPDFSAGVRILLDAGIRVVPWAYVIPGVEQAAQAATLLDEAGSICRTTAAIIDCEAEWYGKPDSEAKRLGSMVSAKGKHPILTSYGAPWYHKTFPWQGFAESTFWGMPQVYDGGERSQGPDYPTRGVQAWSALGYADRLTPLSRAYAAQGQTHYSAKDMLALAKATPIPHGSIGWWDWTALAATPSRWEAIKALEIPGRS